jgi:hypothetical protein
MFTIAMPTKMMNAAAHLDKLADEGSLFSILLPDEILRMLSTSSQCHAPRAPMQAGRGRRVWKTHFVRVVRVVRVPNSGGPFTLHAAQMP